MQYQHLMVPVDLSHLDKIGKSLSTAGELARQLGARVHYVAVTPSQATEAAPTPVAFAERLEAFAREQAEKYGIQAEAKAIRTADPAVNLDDRLLEAIEDLGADLVVMASHVPGVADHLHLMSSNAAYIVRHASVSVFVVR